MKAGDAVKAVTDKLGIKQCDECKKRQQWLNDLSDKLATALKGSDRKEAEDGGRK